MRATSPAGVQQIQGGRWSRRGSSIVVDLERRSVVDLERGGLRGLAELQGEALESEFNFGAFPSAVLEALRKGLETAAVRLAVTFGFRDESRLTSLIFYARHPERAGPITKGEPGFKALSGEWVDIRDRLVRPALAPAKPSGPSSPGVPAGALRYGVPGGKILSAYLKKRSGGYHTGIDVSTFTGKNRGADDPRRGLPVYAALRTSIDLATLNSVQVAVKKALPWKNGLGIPGQGLATLRDARVRVPPAGDRKGNEYGGVVGLACRYTYTKTDGTPGLFTLFVEYWHLITPEYLPKDGQGRVIPLSKWTAAGKGDRLGLGPRMKNGALLKPDDFASPPLVGYLGATQWPHVHIHAGYAEGEKSYVFYPRFDPTAVIQ